MKLGFALMFMCCFAVACTTEQPAAPPPGFKAATTDTTFFQEVSWSPDGSRLLFSRIDIHDDYRSSIGLINADGSGFVQLTNGPADMWTTWGPDGSSFAFASKQDDNRDIYVATIDSGSVQRLTHDAAEDLHPSWSPNGALVAFVSNRNGQSQIYAMRPDGSLVEQLTTSKDDKWNPRWSPDGRRLTYYGSTAPGADSVYVMNADGRNRRSIAAGVWPSWSSDGSRILFVEDGVVYETNTDGGDRRTILDDAVIARWSPDGSQIGFVRVTWRAPAGWPAVAHVFIASANGTNQNQLTY